MVKRGKQPGGRKPSLSSSVELKRIIARGNKALGEQMFTTLRDGSSRIQRYYSTQLVPLNVALSGCISKGLPSGRVVEIFGDEHAGKTTLCALMLASVQSEKGVACIYDTEATFTEDRAVALGIDPDSLIYGEEEYIEGIMESLPVLVSAAKNRSCIIVWDTIAGTSSEHERGRKIGESSIGFHARSLSQGFRKLSRGLAKSKALLICVNQRKEGGIGNPYATERERDATLGGKAIKFHAAVRLRLKYSRKCILKTKGKATYFGDEIKAVVVKNKERGSGTRACECVLVMRKVGKKTGVFDHALSCLRTLQEWGAIKKDSICFANKKYTVDKWVAAYEASKTFRDSVHKLVEVVNNRLNRAETVDGMGKQQLIEEED